MKAYIITMVAIAFMSAGISVSKKDTFELVCYLVLAAWGLWVIL